MIQEGRVNSFLKEMMDGVHQADDQYRIALYRRDAPLVSTVTAYLTTGEVHAPGYTAGGHVLTGRTVTLENGLDGEASVVAVLRFSNPVWPKATITARAALIYNYSKENRAVAVLDLGQDFVSTNGDWYLGFNSLGVIRI